MIFHVLGISKHANTGNNGFVEKQLESKNRVYVENRVSMLNEGCAQEMRVFES
jgi:hypothetical protein